MRDYAGAANHAEALATFVDDLKAIFERKDIQGERKLEAINQLIHGPNGAKVAAQVRESKDYPESE